MTAFRRVDDGVVTGRFTDHHVHLQLVDHTLLADSRLGRVVDLGGNPSVLRELEIHNSGDLRDLRRSCADSGPEAGVSPELRTVAVEYAGAFLTAPGGYPSDRSWAPAGSVREIPDAAAATAAVAALAALGASCIKVVAHSDAGPVLDDDSFRATVAAARSRGLPVVAHAEGPGQAQRAVRLGANRLAHAPFTERLADDEIVEQAASAEWISTLAIHDRQHRGIAIDNVRRFADAGGTVLYGTDMGNGPTPVDLNPAEVDALREAGIDGIRLLHALTPTGDDDLFLPGGDPADARPLTHLEP
ncbi:hydrolase [Microbacterium sp. ARD32]|uniref:hydrolase n=1 Tax=Microbacterium sp. ARD32 TaxID=2962577 RepID=UPI002881E680|nr:hydrolase [Microbacterium sp. ARD32]MDT0158285.1 hydrolase [Microbacterium sp. ARD32]